MQLCNKRTSSPPARGLSLIIGCAIIAASGIAFHRSITFIGVQAAGKVLDINDRLPELVDSHPDKSWLVKFYAPWCYHCQQLEPTYNNVAETIYSKESNLVVGRVDCTKSGAVCAKYGVDSYPTIVHISKGTNVKYKGDRAEASIVAFAERLQGPTVMLVSSCDQLEGAIERHGLVVLSTISNSSSDLRREFESLARAYKSSHWFYQFTGKANGGECISPQINVDDQGLFLLIRHRRKPVRFTSPELGSNSAATGSGEIDKNDSDNQLRTAIVEWLNRESFPVYGQIGYRNFERSLSSGRLLVVAVLDEYKPARRFSNPSAKFHKQFETLARKLSQYEDNAQLLLGWTSDLELIEYITIGSVSTPNVILIKPDHSYHLLVEEGSALPQPTKPETAPSGDGKTGGKDQGVEIPEKLSDHSIRLLIDAAKNDKITFKGGNNYLYIIMRTTMGNVNKITNMYRANPLLVSLIFGFPTAIIIFVIYTTCLYEPREGSRFEGYPSDEDDEDENDDDEDEDVGDQGVREGRSLLDNGHLKQD